MVRTPRHILSPQIRTGPYQLPDHQHLQAQHYRRHQPKNTKNDKRWHTTEKLHSNNLAIDPFESFNLPSPFFILEMARFAILKLQSAHCRQVMSATFLVQVKMIVVLNPALDLDFVCQMKHMTYTLELVG